LPVRTVAAEALGARPVPVLVELDVDVLLPIILLLLLLLDGAAVAVAVVCSLFTALDVAGILLSRDGAVL
jgi:hypothetical protein